MYAPRRHLKLFGIKNSGFSLIEILIAAAIMALAFSVSINSFFNLRNALGTTKNQYEIFREAQNIHNLLTKGASHGLEKDYPLWSIKELALDQNETHLKKYLISHKTEPSIEFITINYVYDESQ